MKARVGMPVLGRRFPLRSVVADATTRALIQSSANTFFLRVVSMGITILTTILFARILGASAYGTFVWASAWLVFLQSVGILGLDVALVRFVAAYCQEGQWSRLRGLVRFAAGTTTLANVIVTGCALVIAWFGVADATVRLTMIITLCALPAAVSGTVWQSVLRGLHRVTASQIPDTMVQPGVLLLAAATLYWARGGVLGAVGLGVANGFAILAALGATAWLVRGALPGDVRSASASYESILWTRTLVPLVLVALIQTVQNRADVLLMGVLATSAQTAVYAVAKRGAEMASFVIDAIGLSVAPMVARAHAGGDRAELQQVVGFAARLGFMVTAPICIAMFLLAPVLLRAFGPEFLAGLDAFRLLCVVQLLGAAAGGPVAQVLYMTGHQRGVAVVMAITATIAALGTALLVPRIGILGGAIATGASTLLFKGLLVLMIRRRLGIDATAFATTPVPAIAAL